MKNYPKDISSSDPLKKNDSLGMVVKKSYSSLYALISLLMSFFMFTIGRQSIQSGMQTDNYVQNSDYINNGIWLMASGLVIFLISICLAGVTIASLNNRVQIICLIIWTLAFISYLFLPIFMFFIFMYADGANVVLNEMFELQKNNVIND